MNASYLIDAVASRGRNAAEQFAHTQCAVNVERIKNFKPHPSGFLGYLLARETHHRRQIILSLKQCGHLPDKKILFGIREWESC